MCTWQGVFSSIFYKVLKTRTGRQIDRFKITLIKGCKYINQTFCVKEKASPSQGDASQFGAVREITLTIAHRKHSIINKICLELFIFSALFYLLYLARPGNYS